MRAFALVLACLVAFGSAAEGATRTQRRQVVRNKRDGTRRERLVAALSRLAHPFCSVQRERTLLDHRGRPLRDRKTGEARRFDMARISLTGRVVELVEVTSHTADKRAQRAKTERLLARRGGVYIRDARNGTLRRVRTLKLTDPISWLSPTALQTQRVSVGRGAVIAGAAGLAGAAAFAHKAGLLAGLAALF